MSDNPLSGKVSLDTTDYKAGVSELNRQIRVIESGFRASAAAMGDWDKSAEGLEMRNKALSSEIDLQKQKIAALTGEYKKIVSEKGADSRAAEEMQIKINKETQALNNSESELKKNEAALKDTKKETNNLGDEQAKTEKKTISLKDAMGGLGKVLGAVAKAVAAVAAAAFAAVGALAGLVLKSAEAADNIEESAQKADLTVERYQELSYIANQTGTSLETITGANSKLIRSMADARDGTGDAAAAFKKLKIDATDSNGALRDSHEVFQEALTKLGGMTNATERNNLAMAIFGKSADELNPLIKAGADEMDKMTKKSHELGAVMSDKAVSGLAAFNDTLAGLKDGLKGTLGELAASFLPGFSGVADTVGGYLTELVSIVKGANGDTGAIASGIGGLFGKIITDIAGKAPEMLQAGMGLLGGLGNAILTALPGILTSLLGMVGQIIGMLGRSIPTLITALMPMIFKLIYGLLGMLPQILTAIMQILVALMQGITAQLPVLIPMLVQILLQMINVLIQNLPLLLNAAMAMIMALVQGLLTALPMLLEQVPVILEALVNFLIENVPMLLVAAVNIILTLVMGLIENIPLLLSAIPKLITALVTKFKSPEFKSQMKDMGKSLIDGLKQGWTDAWTKFKENITKGFKDLVNWIKKLLGIASPAKIMMPIGFALPAGIGAGWKDSFKNLKTMVSSSMLDLTNMSAGAFGGFPNKLSFSGAGGSQVSNQDTYQFFGPVTLQGGPGDSLRQTIKARRY